MTRVSTTGLTVSPCLRLRRSRVLPVAGEVLVEMGQVVEATQPVARAMLPGAVVPVNAATTLGVPVVELKDKMVVATGDSIVCGQVLARSRSFFGWFDHAVEAPVDGTVESISAFTGQIMVRAAPQPLEVTAYLPGKVVEILPQNGVTIESEVALIQGIFGIGKEQLGPLIDLGQTGNGDLSAAQITEAHRDAIVLGRRSIDFEAMKKMIDQGVRGAVVASVDGGEVTRLIGRELNIAATGDEVIDFTLIITEGFGELMMSRNTYQLLAGMNGRQVSINGTTQIRAGVIRPEVIGPPRTEQGERPAATDKQSSRVRIVRGEHFGALGHIEGMPETPVTVSSGVTTRVVEVALDDGRRVTVPRPNVEQLDG